MTKLARVQAVTGLAFAAFLAVHLFTQALAVFGPQTYDAALAAGRRVYQFALLELPMLAAALVHLGCGAWRKWQRRKEPRTPIPLTVRAHRLSGLFLMLAFVGHVAATRLPSVLGDVRLDFAGLQYSFTVAPYFFWPYYPVLGISGALHLLLGTHFALRGLKLTVPWPRSPRALAVACAVAGVLVVLGVFSLGGVPSRDVAPEQSAFAGYLKRLGLVR